MYKSGNSKVTICGIAPSKLPRELLKYVDTEKLIQCINEDYRIEFVLAERLMQDTSIENLGYMRYHTKEIKKFKYLIKAYNHAISIINKNDPKNYKYTYRNDYIFWELLNNDNRIKEMERWFNNKGSIVNQHNLDFAVAFKHFPDKAGDRLASSLQKLKEGYYYYDTEVKNMISTIPKDKIEEVFPEVEKAQPKIRMYMLSNPNATKKYVISGLKAIAKKSSLPPIRVDITPDLLKELSTITRLDVAESIVNSYNHHKCMLPHFKSADELSNILFSSAIRYPDRVENVVKKFKGRLEVYLLNNKPNKDKL